MSTPKHANDRIWHDILALAFSIGIAILLVRSEALSYLLTYVAEYHLLGSFIAGLFFTSLFTTAPAAVALIGLAQMYGVMATAFFGALGATIGDYIIFRLMRDRFSEHIIEIFGHRSMGRRLHALLKLKLFRIVSLFIGGLIIASPLPDELGLGIMGFSKIQTAWFVPFSLLFNFLGILLLGAFLHTV